MQRIKHKREKLNLKGYFFFVFFFIVKLCNCENKIEKKILFSFVVDCLYIESTSFNRVIGIIWTVLSQTPPQSRENKNRNRFSLFHVNHLWEKSLGDLSVKTSGGLNRCSSAVHSILQEWKKQTTWTIHANQPKNEMKRKNEMNNRPTICWYGGVDLNCLTV